MEKYHLAYTGEHLENSAQVLEKLADTYEKLAGKYQEYNPAAASVIMQIREVSRLLMEWTGAYSRETKLENEDLVDIEDVLNKRGVKVKEIWVVERGDGHREIHMYLKTIRKKCPTTREIAQIISEALNSLFDSSENNRIMLNGNFNEYVFVECGQFCLMHGVARRSKAGNSVSGDSYSINEIGQGKVVISLADGMGSGLKANEESRMVIELMEDAIRTGFSEAVAIEMINAAMAMNDIVGVTVTVDMCVLDTLLGIVNFIKLGAVATYIKRDGWVEIIQSETMPIGVLGKADFDHSVKKLYANDYVIMVSDGVLEALPSLEKEEAFLSIITEISSRNPQRMAEEILEKVLEMAGGDERFPNDDMTVLVTGMFER